MPPHDPNETVYRMVRACVDSAGADKNAIPAIGLYFELWILRLAGYLPDWSRCDNCGRVFDDADEPSVQANFHLLCSTCRRGSPRRILTARQRMISAEAMRLAPAAFANAVSDLGDDLAALSAVLRDIISQAIGREAPGEISLAVR